MRWQLPAPQIWQGFRLAVDAARPGLAVIRKFNAEGQSVTPNQAAASMRRAVWRQEQKKLVWQLDVILQIKTRTAFRNIGDRTSESRRIFVLLDFCGVVKMAPPLITQFSATIAGSDH
jgi:hypothetical protein